MSGKRTPEIGTVGKPRRGGNGAGAVLNGRTMAETAMASLDVIAARSRIMGEAVRSPITADYAELSRMMPEKIAAFSMAGMAAMDGWWKTLSIWRAAASHAAVLPGRALTPMGAMEMWMDAGLDMLRLMESGSRIGRDALAPIHRTATANARRLARRKR